VSGKHISEQQVNLYMTQRAKHSQVIAAAKSGLSSRTAGRIDNQIHQPKQANRNWRTREDPLSVIWEPIVLPLLQQSDGLTPIGVFDFLCEQHSDQFDPRTRRTLERRINRWRQLHGSAKEVMFTQTHLPGALGIADFTVVKESVTIAGELLKHRLFHYRLVASRWGYAQVVYGGESFTALSDGLQRAFSASGGVPHELRTDSLSAAYKNRQEQNDFTERYADLCRHYGVKPSRNNRGIAHENGAIESPNNHLKKQLHQALLVRGSHDFSSREDYEAFVQNLLKQRNRRLHSTFLEEQRQLQPLPATQRDNYTEHILSVSRNSTITIKHVLYSVPSRLVSSCVRVRLFDAKLELWCAGEHTLTLTRLFSSSGIRQRNIDYQHVIESLVKKPRAFRFAKWRDDLLPNEDYRHIWQHANTQLPADDACKYIVGLLHLAKKANCEDALGRYALAQIEQASRFNLIDCQQRFLNVIPIIPSLRIQQHALSDYQALLAKVPA